MVLHKRALRVGILRYIELWLANLLELYKGRRYGNVRWDWSNLLTFLVIDWFVRLIGWVLGHWWVRSTPVPDQFHHKNAQCQLPNKNPSNTLSQNRHLFSAQTEFVSYSAPKDGHKISLVIINFQNKNDLALVSVVHNMPNKSPIPLTQLFLLGLSDCCNRVISTLRPMNQ